MPKICRHCKEAFEPLPGPGHKRDHCWKPECIAAHKKYWNRRRRQWAKEQQRKSTRKKLAPGETLQRCQNPKCRQMTVNRFLCPECLRQKSRNAPLDGFTYPESVSF